MQERVQLNISVSREQKLALQALAEGHGTSVTKLVLGLIEVPEVAAVVVEAVPEAIPSPVEPPPVITSPDEVSYAVDHVLSVSPPARVFTPYTKEQQTGKPSKKGKAESIPVCRHGLLRCKVCGSG